MFFRKSKLIQKLRAEIQRLRELLARAEGERDQAQQGFIGMKEVAAKAIEVAKEKQFPKVQIEWKDLTIDWKDLDPTRYLPDPDPYSVKNCPECSVSVRADSWPQECPACHCVFGFNDS